MSSDPNKSDKKIWISPDLRDLGKIEDLTRMPKKDVPPGQDPDRNKSKIPK